MSENNFDIKEVQQENEPEMMVSDEHEETQTSIISISKPKKWYTKIEFIIPTVIALIFFALFISSPSNEDLEKVESELQQTKTAYNDYKEEMDVFEDYSEADLKKAKEIRQEEEEKAKKQLEEEKKKGYNTGITYNQLARDPEKYKTKKVKFSGKVVQVIEGDDEVQIRFAVNGDYDMMIYGGYKSDIISTRILEDDYITIYGTSIGTITYDSTLGGKITIPGVVIDKIDL